MSKLLVATSLVILASTLCFSQDAAPNAATKPAFEVVSIRLGSGQPTVLPNGMRVLGGSQGGPGSPDPERYVGNSVTLRSLIQRAYGMKIYQISGPGWIETSRYDISAKVPAGTTKEQFNLMLQTMLAERFNMKLHHQTKSLPAYNLIVAKSGLKLKEKVSIDACSSGGRPVNGACPQGVNPVSGIAKASGNSGGIMMSPKEGGRIITGRGATLSSLAGMLENQFPGSVVVDKTGLTEAYDFRFEFAPTDVGADGDSSAASIFTALEKELGLKLEATKTPLDCVIIDHIEQPSEN